MKSLRVLFTLSCLLPATLAAAAPADPAVRILAEVPLTFTAKGQRLPVPLVPAKIAGHEGC